ncbi:MAG TPA: Clp protease N-terminal domain-containing protein [Solirubrobacteraceae bacterium]|nr:Clp protease N-terminal domain-containing protein [Solirubrobacteraceae bacterium]
MRLAGQEARELRHSFIGTEHILLALARESDGGAGRALATLGIDHARIRTAVVGMMGLGVEAPEGELAFTGRAQDVIDRARAEASIRDQSQVGTEHILLALVHERSGAAARILLQLDADPAAIRSALAS